MRYEDIEKRFPAVHIYGVLLPSEGTEIDRSTHSYVRVL